MQKLSWKEYFKTRLDVNILDNIAERLDMDKESGEFTDELSTLTVEEIIENYLAYEGIIGYGSDIVSLVEDILGIDLQGMLEDQERSYKATD